MGFGSPGCSFCGPVTALRPENRLRGKRFDGALGASNEGIVAPNEACEGLIWVCAKLGSPKPDGFLVGSL